GDKWVEAIIAEYMPLGAGLFPLIDSALAVFYSSDMKTGRVMTKEESIAKMGVDPSTLSDLFRHRHLGGDLGHEIQETRNHYVDGGYDVQAVGKTTGMETALVLPGFPSPKKIIFVLLALIATGVLSCACGCCCSRARHRRTVKRLTGTRNEYMPIYCT
ncbi:hypothetical protein KIPB_008241, partial [Kipferlia bialata]